MQHGIAVDADGWRRVEAINTMHRGVGYRIVLGPDIRADQD